MTFLHSRTSFDIFSLEYIGNKSSYKKTGNFKGKMKPIGLNDMIFNLSENKGDSYKMTFTGKLNFVGNERIKVLSGIYKGEYNLKDFKSFEGISFTTQKLLLVKI